MRRPASALTGLLALSLLAVACGSDGDDDPVVIEPGGEVDDGGAVDGGDADGGDADGGDADDGEGVLDPDEDGDPAGGAPVADLEAATEAAVADLAETEGVGVDDIEVVAAERVTWSDGSLGCPEPGMMYTQALVPGYRVILQVGGQEVAYHGPEDQAPVRCDDPQPPSDAGS